MSAEDYPPWVVLHLPHDSTLIPDSVRDQFLLDDAELMRELDRMTDHMTCRLFIGSQTAATVVRSPVSRLVVDVERFPDDDQEPMAERGMGAIYTATSDLSTLRRPLSQAERTELMNTYYWPHHDALAQAVSAAVDQFGRCLIIDCHSFSSQALPYEMSNEDEDRPDICIGTDPIHTPKILADAFVREFQQAGYKVSLNSPFSGAMVPATVSKENVKVSSVMVEVNRGIYLDETETLPGRNFEAVANRVKECCIRAAVPKQRGPTRKLPRCPVAEFAALGLC
jgi:N-formylglutamate deformylase